MKTIHRHAKSWMELQPKPRVADWRDNQWEYQKAETHYDSRAFHTRQTARIAAAAEERKRREAIEAGLRG